MNSSNWLRLTAVLLLAVVIQVSVLDQIVIWNAHPDLLVIFPVAAGLLAGPDRGAIIGFLSGLFADLFVSLPYGLSPLSFVLVGFAVGLLASIPGASPGGATQVILAALGAGFGTLVYALAGAVVGQKDLLSKPLVNAVVVVTVASLVLAPAVLAFLRWTFSGSSRSSLGLSVPAGGSATT